jgi:hypothetical protein
VLNACLAYAISIYDSIFSHNNLLSDSASTSITNGSFTSDLSLSAPFYVVGGSYLTASDD